MRKRFVTSTSFRARVPFFAPVCAIVSSVLVCAGAQAAGSPVAIPGLSRLALGATAKIGTANLPKYKYVLLSVGEAPYIPAIKKASPHTIVLAFQSASEAVANCYAKDLDHTCASPISYQQARAHDEAHPSDPWLLYSKAGRSLLMPFYPMSHLANVGSVSYQHEWASVAGARARRLGFDGIYMDSVLGRISDTHTQPTLYKNDADWEKAMLSFVRYVGPTLKSKGLYVLANTYKSGPNDGQDDIVWWSSVAPYVSALQSEYFEQAADAKTPFNMNPCCWTGHWLTWLKLADAAQKHGADFFAIGKGTASNTKLMTYLRASYLLVWNGRGGGFTYAHEPVDKTDPWNGAWAVDIGTPNGARHPVGVAWRRDYSRGTVIVNPHWSRSQTVKLGGTYHTMAGSTVGSVTLPPTTAVILRR